MPKNRSSFDNYKQQNEASRDNYNPAFNSPIMAKGLQEANKFTQNLSKYIDIVSFYRWNPDLWFDLITPEEGGIHLDLDQRIFLRGVARFYNVYGVFPRGYGKTILEVMGMIHAAVFYPNIQLTMTAQTRENAAKILEEKYKELIRFYPLLKDEVFNARFSKDSAEIIFTSGATIDILANHQSSKGSRRHRLQVEESALLNNELFEDVLEPIPNVPRRTIGKIATINPEELNGQIDFFTTSGFRGSDEHGRNLLLLDDMINLKGKIVLGSDWQLACYYGRGESKAQILDKKSKLSPTFFAQNYCSRWVGASLDALVDINNLLKLRVLTTPELKGDGKSDYIIAMDVARSQKTSNNQSSIAVLKLKRNKEGVLIAIQLVNIINLQTGLNFTAQAIELKRIKKLFKAKMAVIDTNGLGVGLLDELMKEQLDPSTGEVLECWDTINTDHEPQYKKAEKCLYALHSQGINHDIIVNFMDMIESGKLQILEKNQDNNYSLTDKNYITNIILPSVNTDLFIEEVSNLKLKHLSGGKYTVERLTKRVDKDRYSAVSYGLYYIKLFEEKKKIRTSTGISSYQFF